MGMSARDVQRCSLWEFMAQIDGYAMANGWKSSGSRGGDDLTDEQLAEMGIEGF